MPDPRRQSQVVVVGNLNTDLIIRGVADLPRWGTEVAGSEHVQTCAGQGGYLALGLQALDVPTELIAAVGDDDRGRGIVNHLRRSGCGTEEIELRQGERTGVSVAIVAPDGERAFVSDFGSSNLVDLETVRRHAGRFPDAAFVCFVGTFNLPGLPLEAVAELALVARGHGARTAFDPGWDPGGWHPETVSAFRRGLAAFDVVLPNAMEAEAITGEKDPLAAAQVLHRWGAGEVVVKCGDLGAVGVDVATNARIAAMVTPVVDAVGAGDAFDAGYLAARLCGLDMSAAMRHATATASLYVSRRTDRFPSAVEVDAALPRMPSPTLLACDQLEART